MMQIAPVSGFAEQLLSESSYAALKAVRCECEAGVLTLRGALPSFYHKQLAQELVARVDGVRRVVNAIEVAYSPA
jgi:osmotically-inducible protein OsmY